ncbi:auxin-responsive protein SAUR36-like [Vigna radiata var. radiata]|uniref:Auxin-responsive protein SAUR36-like n=1 Tax=Vigna radiata var. radiata TaxID=3916 RepID=A0A1S3VC58_VIGRR|nr:auxin-responsive protein SAUR36-like [Vigna radiata var. radiata]
MTMQFRLGKRVFRVATWVFRRVRFRTRPNRYCRLGSTSPSHSYNHNPMTKLLTWGTKLKRGAQSLCKKSGSALVCERAPAVPKGHLAVYVAEDNGECRRVLVPVIYFNHPLFSGLLREAEKEFGFEHPGGITIPCRLTEFERVKTRIASGSGLRGRTRRLGWRLHSS